jgi:hypothetical protein
MSWVRSVFKMESDSEARRKERAATEFLRKQWGIFTSLQNVYGDARVDRIAAGRWAKRERSPKRGNAIFHDEPRGGRPHSDVTPENVQRANDIIRRDRRVGS